MRAGAVENDTILSWECMRVGDPCFLAPTNGGPQGSRLIQRSRWYTWTMHNNIPHTQLPRCVSPPPYVVLHAVHRAEKRDVVLGKLSGNRGFRESFATTIESCGAHSTRNIVLLHFLCGSSPEIHLWRSGDRESDATCSTLYAIPLVVRCHPRSVKLISILVLWHGMTVLHHPSTYTCLHVYRDQM